MKPLALLPLLVLISVTEALLPPESLKQISEDGRRYIAAQFENALSGVRQMKILMDQTGQEHQEILRSLEETKRNKE
ncbi:hypothetical protein GDO81_022242, partial [Engystomops pustulosus]